MPEGDDHVRDLLAAGADALAEAGFRTGDFSVAREKLEAAQAEALLRPDLVARARALDLLGLLAHYENITSLTGGTAVAPGDIDAEERLFRQALTCWQEAGAPAARAQSLFGLGLVFQVLHSDWNAAMPYYWEALELVSAPGADPEVYLRSEVHRHVGYYFLVEAGQPAEAVRHLQISLDLREELGDERLTPSGLTALAQAELEAGNRQRATELLRRAIADSRAAGLLAARIDAAEKLLAEAENG